MSADVQMAEVAALVGDPARANILAALMGGQALTASELAYAAGVSPQTTSGHLGKLTEGCLLSCIKQGRHRYYRIATPRVAEMLEGIMAVVADLPPRHRPLSASDQANARSAHLLRSFRRQARRRHHRRAARAAIWCLRMRAAKSLMAV